MLPMIPASFGWQLTDPLISSYTVLKTMFWMRSEFKKALKYLFNRNE